MNNENPKIKMAAILGVCSIFLAISVMTKFEGTFYASQARYSSVLAVFLGFLMGLFFSRRFKKVRAYVVIAGFVIGGFFLTRFNPTIGAMVIFWLAFLSGLAAGYINYLSEVQKRRTEFGSAEWATLAHLEENNLIGVDGLRLGFFPLNNGFTPEPIHYKGDRHGLIIAPTRSGKGTTFIIPNLLTAQNSCVVIDPKGENALITADRRGKGNEKLNIKGMGQEVHVVDPWGITKFKPSCFNPLGWLKADDIDLNENAMILADSIIAPSPNSNEPFWDEEAKALLMGIILYVALMEKEENKNLGRVRDIISLGEDDMNAILTEMMSSDNIVVQSAGTRTFSKEERIRSSVMASLQAHTHFLDSPRMRESLSKSDFKFEDLKTTSTTIYLVLPADRLETFGRWLRLMIQQALTINARNIEEKPEKPIIFMLDEMANLGRLKMVETAYSLMAGFGVQLLGIIQDVGQLERIYGKGWQTFIGNSGFVQYYGSRDHQTADYFSKLCGVTTIEKFSFSSSIAKAISSTIGKNSSSSSTTTTESTTADVAQRQLAYADELMSLKKDRQILFIENYNPISGIKSPWYHQPEIKNLGINLHKKNPIIQKTIPKQSVAGIEEQTRIYDKELLVFANVCKMRENPSFEWTETLENKYFEYKTSIEKVQTEINEKNLEHFFPNISPILSAKDSFNYQYNNEERSHMVNKASEKVQDAGKKAFEIGEDLLKKGKTYVKEKAKKDE